MATDLFIGIDNKIGVVDQPATVAATTQGKDAEIHFVVANIPDRETALLAIRKLEAVITQLAWPPLP